MITDDNIVESLEQFFASLTVDVGQYPGVTVNPDRATVNITDNDGKTKCVYNNWKYKIIPNKYFNVCSFV